MSVSTVAGAIRHARKVVKEWDQAGFTYWREEHTRYAVIDPVITALGWDTSDPRECHPECCASVAMKTPAWPTTPQDNGFQRHRRPAIDTGDGTPGHGTQERDKRKFCK